MQGVYVGMHNDWTESLDKDDLWPAAENIHIISSATQEEANKWIEGMKADNMQREQQGYSMSWTETDFCQKAEELRNLANAHAEQL